MFLLGFGVPHDAKKAATYYKKSCDGGNGASCYTLGMMYRDGEGVSPHAALEFKYLRRGCGTGIDDSCYALNQYLERENYNENAYAYANTAYSRACSLGSKLGCRYLGQ